MNEVAATDEADVDDRKWHALLRENWRQVLAMLFLGFSAGLPLLLIFSTLSLWLREAGVDRSAVTYFSWAALGYSFKFVWAPLVDKLPLPFLHQHMGKRRSWLLVAQVMVMSAMIWMSKTDPAADWLVCFSFPDLMRSTDG